MAIGTVGGTVDAMLVIATGRHRRSVSSPFDSFRGDPMRRRTEKRLPDFDYTAPGPYWVTIKLHRPQPLFGSVHDDGVHLSDIGEMIDAEWQNLPSRYPSVALDAYVVMPDHIHGLLTLFESP
ncbi:MAG TPA: hypothetical protein VFQ54_00905, partial [Thermomicrobiales bacterium]|nr:hypothetical protein [Thermomicrobiales bacterium]